MKNGTSIALALAAAGALFTTACNESANGPTATEARADLQVMAAKIKSLNTPDGGQMDFIAEKSGAGKPANGGTARAKATAPECDQDGIFYESGLDTSDFGAVSSYWDTTTAYTAAGQPLCGLDDEKAYDITKSYSKDGVSESWLTSRTDYPADFFTGSIKMTGNGKVHYLSGYDLKVEAISMIFSLEKGFTEFTMTLGLENGYGAVLALAPGVDLMSETPPAPSSIVMSGPIKKGGATVGYFEVLANDSVVIRDAAKAVVETHG